MKMNVNNNNNIFNIFNIVVRHASSLTEAFNKSKNNVNLNSNDVLSKSVFAPESKLETSIIKSSSDVVPSTSESSLLPNTSKSVPVLSENISIPKLDLNTQKLESQSSVVTIPSVLDSKLDLKVLPNASPDVSLSSDTSSIIKDDNTSFIVTAPDTRSLPSIVSVTKAVVSSLYVNAVNNNDYYNNKFLRFASHHDKAKFPKIDFSFLKIQETINFVNTNKDLIFITWSVWRWFYNSILNSHRVLIKNIKPISHYYIKHLDLSIRQSDSISSNKIASPDIFINSLLFSNICTKVPNFIGYSVYGLSLCAPDLLLFVPPKYNKMSFSAVLNNDFNQNRINLRFENLNSKDEGSLLKSATNEFHHSEPEKCNEFLATMDINNISKLNPSFKMDSHRTAFYDSSYVDTFHQLYNFDDEEGIKVSISYAQEATATRSASTTREESGKFSSQLGGFMTSNVTTSDVCLSRCDHYILQLILSLQHINDLDLTDIQKSDIMRHFTSLLSIYFLNQVINTQNVTLQSIKISFNLVFNKLEICDFSQMRNMMNSLVVKGSFYPLTPLHYAFCLNSSVRIKDWLKIIVYSSLMIPSLSQSVRTVMPYTDLYSKRVFNEYMNNRSMLCSSHYSSKVSALNIYNDVSVTLKDFILELAVRNYYFDDFKSVIPLISKGEWKGFSGTSPKIDIPYMNSYFVKFSLMSDEDIDKFINDIVYGDPDRPVFIKGSVRCLESIQNVFSRQVDNLDGDVDSVSCSSSNLDQDDLDI